MTESERVEAIDDQIAHVWMVRRFLKHCEEAEDDEELQQISRDLYDFMLAVGPHRTEGDHAGFLKQAKKKLRRLRGASELFVEIQPEVSGHTNFQMAARSLRLAVENIQRLLALPSIPQPTDQDKVP